jgi:hypothetical protein
MGRFAFFALFSLMTFIQGCGVKPSLIPEGITEDQVIDSLYRQSEAIRDFSGWAKVKTKFNSREQSATTIVHFISPDRIKIELKGFAGIELASISAEDDSLTVYFPSYNGYLKGQKGRDLLNKIIPDFDFDLRNFNAFFSVQLPPRDMIKEFHPSLMKKGNRLEVSLERENTVCRYLVEGPQLLIVEENISIGGIPVWQKKSQDFRSVGKVFFPRKISVRNDRGSLDCVFYSVSINSGLTSQDIRLEIPDSAKPLEIFNNKKVKGN